MIKECKVVLHNDKVAVVLFDGNRIQVSNSNLIGKTAYVKYENEKYTVVSKDELDKSSKKKLKTEKLNSKNESVVEVTENIVIDNEGNAE